MYRALTIPRLPRGGSVLWDVEKAATLLRAEFFGLPPVAPPAPIPVPKFPGKKAAYGAITVKPTGIQKRAIYSLPRKVKRRAV